MTYLYSMMSPFCLCTIYTTDFKGYEFLIDKLALSKVVLGEAISKYLLRPGLIIDLNMRGKIVTDQQNNEIFVTMETTDSKLDSSAARMSTNTSNNSNDDATDNMGNMEDNKTPPSTSMSAVSGIATTNSGVSDHGGVSSSSVTISDVLSIQADFKLRDVLDDFSIIESSMTKVLEQYRQDYHVNQSQGATSSNSSSPIRPSVDSLDSSKPFGIEDNGLNEFVSNVY